MPLSIDEVFEEINKTSEIILFSSQIFAIFVALFALVACKPGYGYGGYDDNSGTYFNKFLIIFVKLVLSKSHEFN